MKRQSVKLGIALAFSIIIGTGCTSKEDAAESYLESGKSFFETDDLDKASVQFRNVLQIDPRKADAYYYLGLIAEQNQNWRKMYGFMQKATQTDKNHIGAKVKLSQLLLLTNDIDRAKVEIDAILSDEPNNHQALLLRSSLLMLQKNYDEAVIQAEKSLEAGADKTEILTLKASIAKKQKQFDKAFALIDEALLVAEDRLSLYLFKIDLFRENGDIAGQMRQYELVTREYPLNRYLHVSYARLLVDQKELEKAEALLQSYSNRDPKDSDIKLLIIDVVSRESQSRADEILDTYVQATPNDMKLVFFYINKLYKAGRIKEVIARLSAIKNVNADSDVNDRNPSVIKASAMLAEIHMLSGDVNLALDEINFTLSKDSENELGLLMRARYHIFEADVGSAIADLRIVIRNNPENEDALILLASAYNSSGSDELADDIFRQVLDVNPANIAAVVPIAQAHLADKDIDRSEIVVKNALEKAPGNEKLLALYAQVKLIKKDIEGAEEVVGMFGRSVSGQAYARMLSGRIFQLRNQPELALAQFEEALEIDPGRVRALEQISIIHLRLGRVDELLQYLDHLKAKSPEEETIFLTISSVYQSQKLTQKAIEILKQGIENHPMWTKSYSRLASIYKQEKQNESAIEIYQEALSGRPESNHIKLLLASTHEIEKNYAAAKVLYEEVLEKDRRNDAAMNNLANLLLDRFVSDENTAKALQLSERFANSEQPFFKDTYAWALLKSGDAAGAISVIDQVIEDAPQYAVFHYHKAMIEKKLGNKKNVAKSLEIARGFLQTSETELRDQISNAM